MFFIWKPNRLGMPSYRESHVSGKGVPKSKEINIGMPQRRRQRVPQKWASKERRDCTRAVTDVGQGKRDKRLTPCYRSCACIWLTKNRKLICQESTCERVRASVSENKQFIVHSLRKAANLKIFDDIHGNELVHSPLTVSQCSLPSVRLNFRSLAQDNGFHSFSWSLYFQYMQLSIANGALAFSLHLPTHGRLQSVTARYGTLPWADGGSNHDGILAPVKRWQPHEVRLQLRRMMLALSEVADVQVVDVGDEPEWEQAHYQNQHARSHGSRSGESTHCWMSKDACQERGTDPGEPSSHYGQARAAFRI